MQKHIDLYVNNYSVDLGTEGKRAVKTLFDKAQELGIIDKIEDEIFIRSK
jgi:1,4-dihydroxy-6-naphthoate synthase